MLLCYYLQSRYYDPAIGRFLNADGYISTGQGLLGNNMFAYCGNNSVINADAAGMLFERTAGGGFGSFAYAMPIGSSVAPSATPSSTLSTVLASLIPLTLGIDSLRAETMALRRQRVKEEDQVTTVTIYDTKKDDAVYYGTDTWGGSWGYVTPPMNYEEAKQWTIFTAATKFYGKNATWGLYTAESSDAYMMAWDLGFGCPPISDAPKVGEYRHYHVGGRNLFGIYKHYHVWYGSVYGG